MSSGHVFKRGDGVWAVVVEVGRDAGTDHRKRAVSTVHGNKAAAQRQLRKVLDAVDGGQMPDPARSRVGEFLERWLRDYAAPNVRARTAETYASAIRNHLVPRLGRYRLTKLTPAAVREAQAAMLAAGLSTSTVRDVIGILRHALRDAVEEGTVYRNVVDSVRRPRLQRDEVVPPDADAVAAILEEARATPFSVLFSFMASTGVRRGEGIGLRWSDVDLERRTCSINQTFQRVRGKGLQAQPPKSSRGRRLIALDEDTVELLRGHRAGQVEHRLGVGPAYADHGLVFANTVGAPYDPTHVSHAFARVARRAGHVGVRLHDLRHFHATTLLATNTHIRVVQERLGHATISVTLGTYSHVLPGLDATAAEAAAAALRAARERRGASA